MKKIPDPVNRVDFDQDKLARLKSALANAPGDRHATFMFEDHMYLKAYAVYPVEYLENYFGISREDSQK